MLRRHKKLHSVEGLLSVGPIGDVERGMLISAALRDRRRKHGALAKKEQLGRQEIPITTKDVSRSFRSEKHARSIAQKAMGITMKPRLPEFRCLTDERLGKPWDQIIRTAIIRHLRARRAESDLYREIDIAVSDERRDGRDGLEDDDMSSAWTEAKDDDTWATVETEATTASASGSEGRFERLSLSEQARMDQFAAKMEKRLSLHREYS